MKSKRVDSNIRTLHTTHFSRVIQFIFNNHSYEDDSCVATHHQLYNPEHCFFPSRLIYLAKRYNDDAMRELCATGAKYRKQWKILSQISR